MQFRRIYIKNFQSIKELEIVLEENRCYHIKGNNNIGKSSFLKALQAIVQNVPSRIVDKFIRDNEESFYIEISDFDHNVIRLSRGKEDYYSWIIDGVEGRVDGTSGKVPEEVVKYFNFYMDTEKTKESINIRPPRAKLLFVDTTFGENYFLLQKALRIEEYLSAIKLGESKKREIKKEIVIANDRIEDEKNEIKNLPDYGPLLKDIEVYENAADNYYRQIKEAEEVIKLSNTVIKKEDDLKSKTFDYDRDYVTNLVNKIKDLKEAVDLHNKIKSKERLVEIKLSIIREFSKSLEMYQNLKESLSNKSLLDQVSKIQQKVNHLEKSIVLKQGILNDWEKEEVSKTASIIKSATEIIHNGKNLRDRVGKLKEKEELYTKSEEERKTFMLENKFCPVVLSMKDRKCPFSGKPLEELIGKD